LHTLDDSLIAAVRAGDLEGVRAALAAGGNANARSGVEDWRKPDVDWPALSLAVEGNHLEVARSLIDAGADLEAEHTVTVPGDRSIEQVTQRPLSLAMSLGREDLALLLLERGAAPDACGSLDGGSLLTTAAEKGLNRALDRLLGKGMRDEGALVAATRAARVETMRRLIDAGVRAAPQALFEASLAGREDLAQMLVDAGANVDGDDRCAPLVAAAWFDRVAMIDWLLARGADVSRHGAHALRNAANAGRTAAVRHMVSLGAPIDACDERGWTPLMMAAWQGHTETVRILLDLGADRSLCDRSGRRAVDWAREAKHAEIVELLERR
jgi:ankyrin repeat protein